MTRRNLLGGAVAGIGASITACGNRLGTVPSKTKRRSSFEIVEVRVRPVEMRRIYRTRLAKDDPAFKNTSIYLLLEFVTADGTRGVGELSDVEPTWNAPPSDEFQRVLTELLTRADASDRHRLSAKVAEAIPANWHVELRRMLWAAIDIALLDLVENAMDVPV